MTSLVFDPKTVGPLGVCFRCFTPHSPDFGFCLKCGQIHAHITNFERPEGFACANHKSERASAFCAGCGQPICSHCCTDPCVSLTTGMSVCHCQSCLMEMKALEGGFLQSVKKQNICVKHPSHEARMSCKSCALPHCDACLYYKVGGFFKKRIVDGPYCLPCFRVATLSGGRDKWMSAIDPRSRGWISN